MAYNLLPEEDAILQQPGSSTENYLPSQQQQQRNLSEILSARNYLALQSERIVPITKLCSSKSVYHILDQNKTLLLQGESLPADECCFAITPTPVEIHIQDLQGRPVIEVLFGPTEGNCFVGESKEIQIYGNDPCRSFIGSILAEKVMFSPETYKVQLNNGQMLRVTKFASEFIFKDQVGSTVAVFKPERSKYTVSFSEESNAQVKACLIGFMVLRELFEGPEKSRRQKNHRESGDRRLLIN